MHYPRILLLDVQSIVETLHFLSHRENSLGLSHNGDDSDKLWKHLWAFVSANSSRRDLGFRGDMVEASHF